MNGDNGNSRTTRSNWGSEKNLILLKDLSTGIDPFVKHPYKDDASSISQKAGNSLRKKARELNISSEVEACSPDQDLSMDHIKKQNKEQDIATVKFEEEIKLDTIRNIEYRILCRFLGLSGISELHNSPHEEITLISFLLMQSLSSFMKKNDFEYAGELNFDDNGNIVPTRKNVWIIKGKEISFTTLGFLYFEKKNNSDKKENISFFVSTLNDGMGSIMCFSNSENKSKRMIQDLEKYTKENNCLRGAKIKNINMLKPSFSEVDIKEDYNWDNFYYSDKVQNLFKSEIFGFLNNIEEYNKRGIYKRGVVLTGTMGTGKTSLGYIVCNNLPYHTVIWITPDLIAENNYGTMSIKLLYKLADFVSPCILFLEDLDLFSEDRGGIPSDTLRLGALMNILDGVNSINNSITIGTTNRLELIEKALKNRPGRFDRIVEISVLDDDLRYKMFKNRLKDWKIDEKTLKYLVKNTDGWSGAETQEWVNTLNLDFINSKKKSKKITTSLVDKIVTIMNDFGIGKKSRKDFGFKG